MSQPSLRLTVPVDVDAGASAHLACAPHAACRHPDDVADILGRRAASFQKPSFLSKLDLWLGGVRPRGMAEHQPADVRRAIHASLVVVA